MGPPDAKRSAPGRPTESSVCRGERPDQSTTDVIRPALGMAADEREFRLAQAREAIAAVGRAQRAIRLLEGVAASPRIRAPRHLAGQLRALAAELDDLVVLERAG